MPSPRSWSTPPTMAASRKTHLPLHSTLPFPPSFPLLCLIRGHKTKRPRHEITSENAFSSEGSNKSASGENPKTNAPMRLDTESLISLMRSRQPRSLPDGFLTIAAEESSVQSQQSALSRAQADWETHIKAMEQVRHPHDLNLATFSRCSRRILLLDYLMGLFQKRRWNC